MPVNLALALHLPPSQIMKRSLNHLQRPAKRVSKSWCLPHTSTPGSTLPTNPTITSLCFQGTRRVSILHLLLPPPHFHQNETRAWHKGPEEANDSPGTGLDSLLEEQKKVIPVKLDKFS